MVCNIMGQRGYCCYGYIVGARAIIMGAMGRNDETTVRIFEDRNVCE